MSQTQSCPPIHVLSTALLKWQSRRQYMSWVVTTETAWPAKPKIFTIWSFTENLCSPLIQMHFLHMIGSWCSLSTWTPAGLSVGIVHVTSPCGLSPWAYLGSPLVWGLGSGSELLREQSGSCMEFSDPASEAPCYSIGHAITEVHPGSRRKDTDPTIHWEEWQNHIKGACKIGNIPSLTNTISHMQGF